MARVLIADDESAFREAAADILREADLAVDTVGNGQEAWAKFRESPFDIVVCDIRMPGMDGLELLARMRDIVPAVPVIMITAHGSMESAVEALRKGARDYVTKPCDLDELRLRIRRILAESTMERKAEALERDNRSREFGNILGESAAIRAVCRLIAKVARTPSTVLITGESGSGKEMVAREIHRQSGRCTFVPVNCGAIPEALLESELFGHRKGSFTGAVAHKDGLFRLADNGTLFLDEIGELPQTMQVKLLRALDTGEIQPIGAPGPMKCEPRIIVATNRDLQSGVGDGAFREDLFFRLNVFEVRLPPLRERVEDIPVLADHFVRFHSTRAGKKITGLLPEALRALMAAKWRGNVRELENVIERAVILCDKSEIGLAELPVSLGSNGNGQAEHTPDLKSQTVKFERDYIMNIIEKTGGDKREAAKVLDIGLSSLYRKLEQGHLHS